MSRETRTESRASATWVSLLNRSSSARITLSSPCSSLDVSAGLPRATASLVLRSKSTSRAVITLWFSSSSPRTLPRAWTTDESRKYTARSLVMRWRLWSARTPPYMSARPARRSYTADGLRSTTSWSWATTFPESWTTSSFSE